MIRRLFIFALLLPVSLLADTVILKSGQEVDGQIINQSETTITIRTRQGVQTIGKGTVRRILYGDAYRNQQDELKRKREEELRRKEEEEKRKAEEEAKRLEEQKRKAAEAAREEAEQERLERERREAEEKARLKEQQKEALDARNPWTIWILAGPAGATLMPDAYRDNLSTFRLLGSELVFQPDLEEEEAAVFGFGFSMPIWDMLFLEVDGRATGQTQNYLVLEGGRDTRPGASGATLFGFGTGDYGRIVRTTGDIHLGYRITIAEIAALFNAGTDSAVLKEIELEPFAGYRFRQHDAIFASTAFGQTSFGPADYFANENVDIFSRAKGPSWGLRVLYRLPSDYPLTFELGLQRYELTADTTVDLERNVIYSTPDYREIRSKLAYKSKIAGGAAFLGIRYGVTENIDFFTRIRGEGAEYSTLKLTVSNSDSANFQATNSSISVTVLSPIISPVLNSEEEVGSLELGFIRRY